MNGTLRLRAIAFSILKVHLLVIYIPSVAVEVVHLTLEALFLVSGHQVLLLEISSRFGLHNHVAYHGEESGKSKRCADQQH